MFPAKALILITFLVFISLNYAQNTKNATQDLTSLKADTPSTQQLVLNKVTRNTNKTTKDSKSLKVEKPSVKKLLPNQETRNTNKAIDDSKSLKVDTPSIRALLPNQETRNTNNVTKDLKFLNVDTPSIQQHLLNQETLKRIELENNLRDVQEELEALKRDNRDMRKEFDKIMRDQTEKLTDFKLRVNESIASMKSNEVLDKRLASVRANSTDISDQIAFEARIKSVLEFKGRQGSVVLFDQVLLNDGNGYNSTTGIFIAPKDGLYVFGWHILPGYQTITHTGLIVNNNEISGNYCNTRRNTGQQLCSKMSVVRLAFGDKVWIGYPRPGDNRSKAYFSSFCGFKI